MAALDWFSPAAVVPAPARSPRRRPAPVAVPAARRRVSGRRLTGGIVWISMLALLLAGVVALNVAVLRVNVGLTKLGKQELQLQAQNAALASNVSSAAASLKIEATARRLGLVPAPATDTSYIDLGSPAAKP
jgi:hypothetical protein